LPWLPHSAHRRGGRSASEATFDALTSAFMTDNVREQHHAIPNDDTLGITVEIL
jgi:hypothetical protein